MARKPKIYLDYNATAPLRPTVVNAMQEVMAMPLNASSNHQFGRKAKSISEDTRRKLAEFINCFPQEIIWCGSASEANNAVVKQFAPEDVLVSAIEHSATLNACDGLEQIPVTADGVVDLAWLEKRLTKGKKVKLISVMFANNETGVIQPTTEIVKLAKAHGALVHSDAVQAIGKALFDVNSLGIDYASIGFHKNGGPVGIAAMVVRDGSPFKPFICGGGQEFNRRAGTENITAIAGVNALVDCYDFDELKQVKAWMAEMEDNILNISTPLAPSSLPTPLAGGARGGHSPHQDSIATTEFAENALPSDRYALSSPPASGVGKIPIIIGKNAPRLGHVSCIITPGISREVQLMRMDLANICVSAGSACTSGKTAPSHVLKAMGISDEVASSAMRVSGGWDTKKEDVDAFVKAWFTMYANQPEPDAIAS